MKVKFAQDVNFGSHDYVLSKRGSMLRGIFFASRKLDVFTCES